MEEGMEIPRLQKGCFLNPKEQNTRGDSKFVLSKSVKKNHSGREVLKKKNKNVKNGHRGTANWKRVCKISKVGCITLEFR